MIEINANGQKINAALVRELLWRVACPPFQMRIGPMWDEMLRVGYRWRTSPEQMIEWEESGVMIQHVPVNQAIEDLHDLNRCERSISDIPVDLELGPTLRDTILLLNSQHNVVARLYGLYVKEVAV